MSNCFLAFQLYIRSFFLQSSCTCIITKNYYIYPNIQKYLLCAASATDTCHNFVKWSWPFVAPHVLGSCVRGKEEVYISRYYHNPIILVGFPCRLLIAARGENTFIATQEGMTLAVTKVGRTARRKQKRVVLGAGRSRARG